MARMNISVPDDVKDRMDAVEEPVNWSAVASRAFSIELGEIAKRNQEKDMSAVIDRLRASKIEHMDVKEMEGFDAGQEWATQTAEFHELDRLADAKAKNESIWDDLFDTGNNSVWSAAELMHAYINGAEQPDRQESAEFWESTCDDTAPDNEFVRGFCEGALEIYWSVADEI